MVRALIATRRAALCPELQPLAVLLLPGARGDYLYIGSHAGKLIAIDLKDGKTRVGFATDGASRTAARSPARTASPNYKAAFGDSFYDDVIIGADRMMSVGAVLSSPVVDGDTLYFGSWDGQLYALG